MLTTLLDTDDRERLLLAMEASLRVCNTSGFFLWSQGALRALIPHDILICITGGGARGGPMVRHFSSCRYFEQRHLDACMEGGDALVPRLMHEWELTGQPQFLLPRVDDTAMRKTLDELELRNLIACGVRGIEPQTGAFFCFSRTSLDRSDRTARLLELLLPYVHSTYCRVLHEERQVPVGSGAARGGMVTKREMEILHLIKNGHKTSDIAEQLCLSPFTVRNHVKKIFRKLNAKSRSHAVAQAISHGILINRREQ